MAVITTGAHPKALWPGVKAFFGQTYAALPKYCEQMFDVQSSDKKYEEDVELIGFGLAPVKSEAASVSYDTTAQGPVTRYTHVTYGLGYIVTQEAIEDNQYEKVSRMYARALARSMYTTKETVAANVFNRGFNSSYVGGDGVELLSTAHPTANGTQSNELATAADLSEASLEDLMIQINNATDSRGIRIGLKGQKLLIPTALQFVAKRILGSDMQSGTANNDVNAMKAMGMLPGGMVVNPFLSDSDAFFVLTDAPDGRKLYQRRAMAFTKDNDFDTENAKAKATERYSMGWSDWRSVYGSPGA